MFTWHKASAQSTRLGEWLSARQKERETQAWAAPASLSVSSCQGCLEKSHWGGGCGSWTRCSKSWLPFPCLFYWAIWAGREERKIYSLHFILQRGRSIGGIVQLQTLKQPQAFLMIFAWALRPFITQPLASSASSCTTKAPNAVCLFFPPGFPRCLFPCLNHICHSFFCLTDSSSDFPVQFVYVTLELLSALNLPPRGKETAGEPSMGLTGMHTPHPTQALAQSGCYGAVMWRRKCCAKEGIRDILSGLHSSEVLTLKLDPIRLAFPGSFHQERTWPRRGHTVGGTAR